MNKKELLYKVNWSRKDISTYFSLTIQQVRRALIKGEIKPLKVNTRKYSIEDVLKGFGTSLERELRTHNK